jgi:hypothetical protein
VSYASPVLNAIPKVSNTISPGTLSNSSLLDNGSSVTTPEPFQAASGVFGSAGAMSQEITTFYVNDTTTGTAAAFLAKSVGTTAIKTGVADTTVPRLWIVVASATGCASGTTGQACLVLGGQATLTFDAAGATSGHLVGESTTVAGAGTDLGTTHTGVTCVGEVTANVAANGTGVVQIGACGP